MTARRVLAVVLITAAVVVAFAGTYAARVRSTATTVPTTSAASVEPLLNWLGVPADQRVEIRNHDPRFAEDLARLRADLAGARDALASALENPQASDEEVRSRVEAALAANAAMERRVTDYVLAIRHHLTGDQQQRLLGLCAEGVRQGPGRGRHMGMGMGMGGGGGPRGPGRGAGRGQQMHPQ